MEPTPEEFIRSNLTIGSVEGLAGLRLYMPHPASGLRHLRGSSGDSTPYWAYVWAGGAALACHILAHPETVAGRRIMDIGTGSGIVAIAAARAGATHVAAADRDRYAVAAARLNAALNGVSIDVRLADILDKEPPSVDMMLAGDLFYSARVAAHASSFLDRCLGAGIEVLIGDPGRVHLPRERLRLLAEYQVADMGLSGSAKVPGSVFAWHLAEGDPALI